MEIHEINAHCLIDSYPQLGSKYRSHITMSFLKSTFLIFYFRGDSGDFLVLSESENQIEIFWLKSKIETSFAEKKPKKNRFEDKMFHVQTFEGNRMINE